MYKWSNSTNTRCRPGATLGNKVDSFITWFIDLVLSVPHTLVVILISISVGGGLRGIVLGVFSLTHWAFFD